MNSNLHNPTASVRRAACQLQALVSWLLDLDYKFNLTPATTLNLHGGYQKIANFSEANFSDLRVGITHKHWGFEWNADWVTTHTRVRELYLALDGDKLKATDDNKLALSVSRRF